MSDTLVDVFGVVRDTDSRTGVAYRYVKRAVQHEFVPGISSLVMGFHGGRNTSRKDRSFLFSEIERKIEAEKFKKKQQLLVAKMKGLNVHAKPFVPESVRKSSNIPLYQLAYDPIKPRKFFRGRRKNNRIKYEKPKPKYNDPWDGYDSDDKYIFRTPPHLWDDQLSENALSALKARNRRLAMRKKNQP